MSRAATFCRLVVFDLRHMVTSPLFLLGSVALLGYLYVSGVWYVHSVALTEFHDNLEAASAGVAVLLSAVVTFPAMREVRYSRLTVSNLGPVGRLVALGTAAMVISTACLVGLVMENLWWVPEPMAGTLSPFALPTPFLLALAGPLLSIAVVAWTRTHLPLVVLALAVPAIGLYEFATIDVGLDNAMVQMSRVTMLVQQPFPIATPSLTLPSALYLAYMCLFTAVLVALIVAARGRRRARRAALVAAAVLLAGAAGTAGYGNAVQSYGASFADDQVHGGATDPCESRDGITYCPLPGHRQWVDDWHAIIGPALAQLPEAAREDPPLVWQDALEYDRELDVPADSNVVVYGVSDLRGASEEASHERSLLVGQAALAAMGMSETYWEMCRATGQSRVLVMAWLVGRTEGMSPTDRLDGVVLAMSEYYPSPGDLELARALVEDVPPERMAAVLEEHWDRLSSPAGSSAELAGLLDVTVAGHFDGAADNGDYARLFPEIDTAFYEPWGGDPACA